MANDKDFKSKLKEKIEIAKKLVEGLENEKEVFTAILTAELLKSNGTLNKTSKLLKPTEYRKDSSAFYLEKLIDETEFFQTNPIRTTLEIADRLKQKYNKTVIIANATRDFFPLVRAGKLDRDYISPSPKFPKGMYIWFLPKTEKSLIENFKRSAKSGSK